MTTTARRRGRLLAPAAAAALALGATTAAAASSAVPSASAATSASAASAHDHQAAKNPKAMLDAWLRLWNGDYTQAPRIISPDFTVHAAMLDGGDGSAIRGADGLVAWIAQTRAAFPDLRFTPQLDSLVSGHHASLRWTATGTYTGGFPGAKAEPGTTITFTGTDTLRMENGKFAEYWLNSDTFQLLTQLQVL
ncbi:ester cyclase [Streptomyces sp. NRRL S-350]|uniref:ester cyclase n=1 Tax=Streptomyces sp. NRRL S-350 TaxID=1463902 RepID=UPI000A3E7246|nr:ester cyclase [Streptomyces sp. NRRL S-350]